MGRTRRELKTAGKVVDRLSFGVLARGLPRAVVEEELAKAGRKEERVRSLPSYLVVYYALSMCLYSEVGVEQVLRWVLEGARNLFGAEGLKIATKGAISSARARVGSEVLESLYRRVVGPLAGKAGRWGWHQGLRLVALDGSTLDLQDTQANAKHYGYANGGRGECAFPKLRFVSLVEVGTRVIFGARMGPYAKSEQALAAEVIASLGKGMLCLADRLFYSHGFWKQAAGTGAHLLWRVKNNMVLPVEQRLPDGSWLSSVYPDAKSRRKKQNGIQVRVIAYRLAGPDAPKEKYLLVTTLLDHQEHPAAILAGLYPLRWEIEIAYDEFKTHLRGGRVVLRSKTPELVKQEFFGFLLAHFCARQLMHEAAIVNDIEPDRLSFTHTIEILKRKLPVANAAFSPSAAQTPSPPAHS